ncbi:MAG: DNA-processing protein DprA [Bacteroidales bacterium]|nr:DNA-processing protein DprA [Bacteroidales bacterium]
MSHPDHSELQYRIALTMVPEIGPITARKLIDKIGTVRAIFEEKQETLMKIKGIGPRLSGSIKSVRLLGEAEKEVEFLLRHRISAYYYLDQDYPERLKHCEDAPILLYARGQQGLNAGRILSVVGTRKATSYGRDICRELIRGLASLLDNPVIVSGLAYGIDVIAHRTALECGLLTVAVLGHGLSTIYPWVHRETAKKISKQGALVTDFHSGMGPERNNFLRRNRIIAGLSDATLVIESGEKGGALITADMAASYDRDVLAVPGRVDDERSRGCNGMIRSNLAALVETPVDIINHLNWEESTLPARSLPAPEISPSMDEKRIMALIEQVPGIVSGTISTRTEIPINRTLALLMGMELKEWISIEPGNRYRLRISIP